MLLLRSDPRHETLRLGSIPFGFSIATGDGQGLGTYTLVMD